MWKQKYMFKNLLFFLVPLMVPILIFGAFSILITQHFIKNDVNQKNWNLLAQTRDSLELILNEMDTLSLSYQANHNISVRLKSILNATRLEYEQVLQLELFINFLSSPANARPYIDSIYVYYDNPAGRVLTSTEGLATIGNFYDTDWFRSYQAGNSDDTWIEERNIDRFGLGKNRIVTIYRKLYTPGSKQATGILVLNISPAYIDSLLQDLAPSKEQTLLIADQQDRILFHSNRTPDLSATDLQQISASPADQLPLRTSTQSFAVSHIQSEQHELHYILLIPQDVLYRVPTLLRQVTFILLIGSFLIGIAITYILTKRNYNNLKNIVSIISAAKHDRPLPMQLNKVSDEYGFILQNFIKTFIEQDFLKTQLSNRSYELKYMELLALQSQINPHFLYNTLEIINWKTLGLSGGPNDASKMIEHLSDILKYALSSPKQTVIVNEEIRYTEIYLEIQKIRNKDKLSVIWDVDDDTRYLPILKLILQPLIENSIYHGIKEKTGRCAIKIKIHHKSPNIWIRVIDNGRGMTKRRLKEVRDRLEGTEVLSVHSGDASSRSGSGHIGLSNSSKRLILSYGREHGLRILSKDGWGTSVEITIPIEARQS
ncbi:histidine kinase [Paenibacillus sepulcri]|uniref:Histidine kinase n=1 Tax=Paenibacillus sepulcri TaxID=359917 RepID=A0ABS7C0M7_9BACL|nr:histidine kinase [Paenibacillus sepulcri]